MSSQCAPHSNDSFRDRFAARTMKENEVFGTEQERNRKSKDEIGNQRNRETDRQTYSDRETDRKIGRHVKRHTSTVSLVTVISNAAVLMSITYELFHNTPPIVTLEIPGVFAVRCYNHNITTAEYN